MNRAHHIDFYACVQTELLRDPRHFRRRHHDADRKQDVVRHGEKPKEKQCRLQKCRKAKRDDLFDPLIKTVIISSRYGEHIQRTYSDLYQQNTAALDVVKEYLEHEESERDQHD